MVRHHAKPCDVFGEIMGEILRKVWKSEECVNGAAKNSPHRQLKRSTAASYATTGHTSIGRGRNASNLQSENRTIKT